MKKPREHAEPGAPAVRRVLGRDQRRPAPLAAKPDALQEAQRGEEPRRENAGRRISRERADQGRRQAHHQHGGDQRRLAPDPVAEMPEQERANGAGEKGDAEGEIGVERLGLGGGLGEEHRPEHQRRRSAEDVEVVEFDRRADEARQHDPAHSRAPRLRPRRSRSLNCRHCRFSLSQARSKSSQIEQNPAKPGPKQSKEKAWISLDSLGGNEPFQRLAPTPRAFFLFGPEGRDDQLRFHVEMATAWRIPQVSLRFAVDRIGHGKRDCSTSFDFQKADVRFC